MLLTDVCKFSIGRLRPYFITIYKPDLHYVCYDAEVIYISDNEMYYGDYYYKEYVIGDTCTDNKDLMKEDRFSFVSGHSAISFYIATFLIIFMKKYMNIRILKNLLHVENFILALWISLSRLGMEVNIEETQELIRNLTPVHKPSNKTHGVIFFERLETDSDSVIQVSSSAPSREEVEVLQSSISAHKMILLRPLKFQKVS